MAISVVMPALEMAQETGKLVSWLKKEGDSIRKGDLLLEVETDKAVVEIEAQGAGVLAGIAARAGDVVPVGQTIAWLVEPGEMVPTIEQAAPSARTSSAATWISDPVSSKPTQRTARVKISPKARRLAQEKGIDLEQVSGSGDGGEILTADILTAASALVPSSSNATSTLPVHTEKPNQVGRIMAERTVASWTTVPHFFLEREVDASGLLAARAALTPVVENSRGIRPTYTDLLVAIVGRVLVKHPRMNASWNGGEIRLNSEINVAVAVSVPGGVATIVVPKADFAELGEIAVGVKILAERARTGKLRPHDITGGTFTISNLGMFAVDSFSAIITPPQAAILAVGRIADRATVVEGAIQVRPCVKITISADHRVIDGAGAAKFLGDLAEAIAAPMTVFTS